MITFLLMRSSLSKKCFGLHLLFVAGAQRTFSRAFHKNFSSRRFDLNLFRGRLPLWLSLFALLQSRALAQRWIQYTINDGLPSNSITAIAEDTHDDIWVGTWLGLGRYDGRDWTHFSRAQGGALIDDRVTALLRDREGNLWIGTVAGFSKIDPASDLNNPQNWSSYDKASTASGLIDNYINTILEDSLGNIWFGTAAGISIAKAHALVHRDLLHVRANWEILIPEGLAEDKNIPALARDRFGNVWVGTQEGAERYSLKTFKETGKWMRDVALALGTVTAIHADRQGFVWFGRLGSLLAPKGVARVALATPTIIESFPQAEDTEAIAEDSEGKIWFGTADRGVYIVDPYADLRLSQNWLQLKTDPNGLAANAISSLLPDTEGDVWVGTAVKGISKFDVSWLNLARQVGFGDESVLAIADDDSNRLWFGTKGGGIRRVSRSANLLLARTWEQLTSSEKALSSNSINVIFRDHAGYFWIGSTAESSDYPGLNGIDPRADWNDFNKWIWFSGRDSLLPGANVFAIAEEASAYLWIGTEKGLGRVRADSMKYQSAWKNFTVSDSLFSNHIQALLLDDENRLWVGTTSGLNWSALPLAANAKWQRHAITDEVQTIYQDSARALWVGTRRNGVYKILPSHDLWTTTHFTTRNGLAANDVRAIVQSNVQSDSNTYWFTTNSGLTRLRIHDGDSLWTNFKPNDGPSDLSLHAAFKDSRGDLWFGTANNGVTRHRIKNMPPDTRIISKHDVITAEDVIVRFKGFDRGTPAQAFRYSFRVDAGEWSAFTASEETSLFGLNEGRHVFEVRAADNDGNIDASPATDVFYKIDPGHGGKAEFADSLGRISVYFPPLQLAHLGKVDIAHVDNYTLADSLAVLAYDIQPAETLSWPATLAITFRNTKGYRKDSLAIFQRMPNAAWNPLGGRVSVENDSVTITTAINALGTYAVRRAKLADAPRATIAEVNIQPRIFSPRGEGQGFGNRASISFSLGQATEATIKIYNLAGRLKKVLIANESFLAGKHAVEWDGRDDDGKDCVSGLHVVTIAARGEVATKTVMILNKY